MQATTTGTNNTEGLGVQSHTVGTPLDPLPLPTAVARRGPLGWSSISLSLFLLTVAPAAPCLSLVSDLPDFRCYEHHNMKDRRAM